MQVIKDVQYGRLGGNAGCQAALRNSKNQHIGRDFWNSLSYKCFHVKKNPIFNEASQKIKGGVRSELIRSHNGRKMIRFPKKLCQNSTVVATV